MPPKTRKLTHYVPIALSPADAKLRDQLWMMATRIDWDVKDIEAIQGSAEYVAFDTAMQDRPVEIFQVPGFTASPQDIAKIRDEVSDSCLNTSTKTSLLKALDQAKAK